MPKLPDSVVEMMEELKYMQSIDPNTPGLKKLIRTTKKSIEQGLYDFVSNGCEEYGECRGAFPELRAYYNERSYKLLDEKIRVLSEIAKQGPDCDYTNIDGFNDILEDKVPGLVAKLYD